MGDDNLTPEDRDFLRSVENCSIGKTCFNHLSHIRMAWLELELQGGFEPGLKKIRSSLQRYLSAVGAVGYHETVTVAFARLIHYRRQIGLPDWKFDAFARANGDLLSKESPILTKYYSSAILKSDEARQRFITADIKPLPLGGLVRPVKVDDAEAILSIYAPYVTDTPISFETEVPSLDSFRNRILETGTTHTWLVFEIDGGLAGYAYGSKHRERTAYQWTTEVSAYVDPKFHRTGVARALYTRLFRDLRRQGYRLALGGIALPNPASVGLHEAMGFEHVGVYKNIGFKLGKWHDTGWWQMSLSESPGLPPDPLQKRSISFPAK